MLGWRLKPTHSYALPKYLTVFIPTQIPEPYTNGLSQEERQKHAYIKVFQTVTNKLKRTHDKHHDYRGRQNILSIQHLKYSSSCIIPKHTTIINIYKRTLIFLFEAGLNFPTGTGPDRFNRSGPVPVPVGLKPAPIQNSNLNFKK